MKPLRIGVIILIIGTTLLFATNARGATQSTGGAVEGQHPFGPVLLEPRETTIVRRDVSPENATFTVSLVDKQSWETRLNITKVNPAFSVDGMQRLCSVTFKLGMRGLYYVVVTGSTGEPAERIDMTVEQYGIAEDLLAISLIATIVGTLIITTDQLRPVIRRKPKARSE